MYKFLKFSLWISTCTYISTILTVNQSFVRTYGLNSYITRQPLFFKLRDVYRKNNRSNRQKLFTKNRSNRPISGQLKEKFGHAAHEVEYQ